MFAEELNEGKRGSRVTKSGGDDEFSLGEYQVQILKKLLSLFRDEEAKKSMRRAIR